MMLQTLVMNHMESVLLFLKLPIPIQFDLILLTGEHILRVTRSDSREYAKNFCWKSTTDRRLHS